MVNKVIQRNIRISSRKAALVCDLIRNKSVREAIIILNNTDKKISPIIKKLLNSAIANATNNHAMNAEKLYIYNIFANQGPSLKRTMPRARGSADLIKKRTTHLEIHLSDNPNERQQSFIAAKELKAKQRNSGKANKEVVSTNTSKPKVEKTEEKTVATKIATPKVIKTEEKVTTTKASPKVIKTEAKVTTTKTAKPKVAKTEEKATTTKTAKPKVVKAESKE